MLEVDIPHFGVLRLLHLVCDVNGTLADGAELHEGVAESIARLRERITVHLLTSDTHGAQGRIDRELRMTAVRIPPDEPAALFKERYLRRLGAAGCAALGNGRNDRLMLRAARLAVAVLAGEGAAAETLAEADIVVTSGAAALRLLLVPALLVATLRG
jgi:soluble P-type ATPase